MDYYSLFWGLGVISMIDKPRGAFMCRSSTHAVWPILARFMDYYSLFWGPGVISSINEPWGAFTCRSSTLTILDDSVPLHVLLLSILGVPERFPRLTIPGCVYVSSVINTHSFGQFWPVSWTITHHFWGPKAVSMVVEPQGAVMCWSSTLIVLADSGPFCGLFLTVLGSRSDFHD